MKDQWYCGVDGQQYGPYTWDQLRAMAAEGRIVPETYVRREIDQQWLSAAHIPGLLVRKKAAKKTAAAGASVSRSDSGAFASVDTAPTTTVSSAATVTPSAPAAAAPSSATATKKLKAKPLASPPKGATVAASPAVVVVPIGQAVGAVPVGQPVGLAEPPVGVPLGFAISTQPPPKAGRAADDDEELPRRKKGSPLILVGVLGGVVLAVAIVGVAAIAWNWSQTADDAVAVASADGESRELGDTPPTEGNPGEAGAANSEDAESNPGEATDSSDAAKAAKGDGSTDQKLSGKTVAAAKKVISSQTKWTDLLRHKEIKINNVSMSVTSVWLASDLTGTRVEPQIAVSPAAATTDASAQKPAVPSSETPSESSAANVSPAKYVFVEVRIANAAPVPRRYNSWNAAEATAAVLASDAGEILTPVPIAATAGVNRLKNVQVQPGQSVFDVLVFEAPPQPFESLKLALAKNAVADGAKGHWAFAVPLEAMFRKRPGLADSPARSEPAAEPPVASAQSAPASAGPLNYKENTPPPTDAAPDIDLQRQPTAAEKSKVNKPPSTEELNKQFEEFDKSRPLDAGKEPAKMPAKPEPAKPEPAKSDTNPPIKS